MTAEKEKKGRLRALGAKVQDSEGELRLGREKQKTQHNEKTKRNSDHGLLKRTRCQLIVSFETIYWVPGYAC